MKKVVCVDFTKEELTGIRKRRGSMLRPYKNQIFYLFFIEECTLVEIKEWLDKYHDIKCTTQNISMFIKRYQKECVDLELIINIVPKKELEKFLDADNQGDKENKSCIPEVSENNSKEVNSDSESDDWSDAEMVDWIDPEDDWANL